MALHKLRTIFVTALLFAALALSFLAGGYFASRQFNRVQQLGTIASAQFFLSQLRMLHDGKTEETEKYTKTWLVEQLDILRAEIAHDKDFGASDELLKLRAQVAEYAKAHPADGIVPP